MTITISQDVSPNLSLLYVAEGQHKATITADRSTRVLDVLVHLAIMDRDLSAAPESHNDGDTYLVAGTPAAGDLWEDHGGDVAFWSEDEELWRFRTPRAGWLMWVSDEDVVVIYNGSTWSQYQGGAGGGGDPPPLQSHVAKSADQNTRATSPESDSELTFAVAANEKWSFIIHAFASSPVGDDLKITMSAPASPTTFRWGLLHDTINIARTSGTDTIVTLGTREQIIIAGAIINGANAGSVTFQFSKNVDSDPGTATVFGGSWLQSWKGA